MIVGESVRLRATRRDDLPRFVEWFSDPEVRRYMDIYLPFSMEQEERWFEQLQRQLESREIVMLTIETEEGARIGNISLFDIDWKDRHAELGITIGDKDHWNHGYGCDAIRAMLRLAFEEMNLHRVSLRVHEDNVRGIRCYEKAGFRREGTLRECVFREGTYLDMIVMSILRGEFESRG